MYGSFFLSFEILDVFTTTNTGLYWEVLESGRGCSYKEFEVTRLLSESLRTIFTSKDSG